MSIISRNGLDFHVQTFGSGPLVVMLHGGMTSSLASWFFTVAPVIASTHTVFLYDMRGHGLSQKVRCGYDLETLTDDLDALLPVDSSEKVILVGHSYGALVALKFAIRSPQRIRKLCIVDAPLPPCGVETFLDAGTPLTTENILSSLPGPLQGFLNLHSRKVRKFLDSIQFLIEQSSFLSDMAKEPPISDQSLRLVSCETLLVYGESSSCLVNGRHLASVLPHSHLTIVPGGHYVHLESTKVLAQHVKEFLHVGSYCKRS